MTYYENLRTYLAEGRVYAKNHPSMQPGYRISYEDIVARRGGEFYTTPCGSNINQFVPFYFSTITKMAFAVHIGNVRLRSPEGVDLGPASMDDVVYVVVDPGRLFASGRVCWFTNVACNSAIPPEYRDSQTDLLTHVDWPLFDDFPRTAHIPEIGYAGVCKWQHDRDEPVEHQMRSKKRMAEFMVKDYLRMDEVSCIVSKNEKIAGEVQDWVNASSVATPVYVKPNCYF